MESLIGVYNDFLDIIEEVTPASPEAIKSYKEKGERINNHIEYLKGLKKKKV